MMGKIKKLNDDIKRKPTPQKTLTKKVQKVHPKKGTIKASKFDEAKRLKYLGFIAEGQGKIQAAKDVGVNIKTVDRHMASNPGFKTDVSLAETEVNQKVENALYKAATSGNTTAMQVWLYNRYPERWTDKRNINLAGPDGGPIEVDIGIKELSDEELIGIIRRGRSRRAAEKKSSSK